MGEGVAQLTQRRDFRVGFGLVSERPLIVEIETTVLQPRPRDSALRQPTSEAIFSEAGAFVDAKIMVYSLYQTRFDIHPVIAQRLRSAPEWA